MRGLAVRLIASMIAVVGLVHVIAATDRLHARAAVEVIDGGTAGRLQGLLFGLTLLALAHGLAGGRRLARYVAVAGLLLASLTAVHDGVVRVAALGGPAIVLAGLRSQFPAVPDPRRLRLAGQLSLGLLALVTIGSGWGFAAYQENPRQLGAAILAGFNVAGPPAITHDSMLAALVGLGAFGLLVLVFTAAPAPAPGDAAERSLVALLTDDAAADSLAPFATRHDKSYVFSPDRRAAIGYRVVFGTALAGGDPVGAPAAAGAAVTEFLKLCERQGWRPAVLGASLAAGPAWHAHHLHGLTIGDEAVLDVATFSLASRRMRNVRQAVRRTHNAGVDVWIGPMTEERAATLRPVLADWLGGHAERGFAMNLDQILVPRADCRFIIVYDQQARPVAFARFARCAGGRILTLDVAPRRHDAPNGVVERLVVDMVEHARAEGAAEVSLNFAGLRQVFESTSPAGRAAVVALRLFDPWIELWPLYRFCAKFHPAWRPRQLLLRGWLSFAPVLVAALTAEFGEHPVTPAAAESNAPGRLLT
jgi:lysylphosphatidylglycerol synthetase-like protein (DUF2156 family)